MQSKKIIATILMITGAFLSSCKEDFQPDQDNHSGDGRFANDPGFAEGILLNGYTAMPNVYSLDEVATDDAATNDKASSLLRMATGEWSSRFDPLNIWDLAYKQIYYMNYFLSIADQVTYSYEDRVAPSAERNEMFKKRFKAEAKALRAWYNFELLKRHGGMASDGVPRGFVIMKTLLDKNSDWNIPRNTYEECVNFILADLDEAAAVLPDVYANKGVNDLNYNAVFGAQNKNRVNGQFVKALKSRLLLQVASQTFTTAPEKWENAAAAAAALLVPYGGPTGLSATGLTWWRLNADKEILWRRDIQNINSRELGNFPPSLFGRGQTNPSQNLVNAFPMANGTPITLSSQYNSQAPYANRDPRLKAYIIYNGNTINNKVINTTVEDPKNGINQNIQATRTGYYLKKLLQEAVNLDPKSTTNAQHFYTLFRYTELFLNYAEAANEAWGPNADPKGYGFTASQVIAAIRKRGGITQPDVYLTTITSKDDMRTLIRNERRIELCFEGFRFWDMRRWKLDLTEKVKGMSITAGQFSIIDVEDRLYAPYMQYGPIPNAEILKSKVIQNAGW